MYTATYPRLILHAVLVCDSILVTWPGLKCVAGQGADCRPACIELPLQSQPSRELCGRRQVCEMVSESSAAPSGQD